MPLSKIAVIPAAGVLALSAAVAGGCSCSSGGGGEARADTTSAAYRDGRRDAMNMIYTANDSTDIQNSILEFQAANYQIELDEGHEAAVSNRQGFIDGVREADPGLAAEIF